LFDILVGIQAFFLPNAMELFLEKMKASMDAYGEVKHNGTGNTTHAHVFGVIPMNVTDYWDSLQKIVSHSSKFYF
jgi:hypothetical protein